jgi:hypothetical protein
MPQEKGRTRCIRDGDDTARTAHRARDRFARSRSSNARGLVCRGALLFHGDLLRVLASRLRSLRCLTNKALLGGALTCAPSSQPGPRGRRRNARNERRNSEQRLRGGSGSRLRQLSERINRLAPRGAKATLPLRECGSSSSHSFSGSTGNQNEIDDASCHCSFRFSLFGLCTRANARDADARRASRAGARSGARSGSGSGSGFGRAG